jgi:hypothetical protein
VIGRVYSRNKKFGKDGKHMSLEYLSIIHLTHSAAPSPAFEGGVKKRRSGSTLSKPQHLCWGVEGLICCNEFRG